MAEMTEPFLINPVRKRRRRRLNPLVYPAHTAIVGGRKRKIKAKSIAPETGRVIRRKKRKAVRHAAPVKRRTTRVARRKKRTVVRRAKRRVARRKHLTLGRVGSRHRPVVYNRGGHWTTSKKAKLAKPGVRVNPFGEEVLVLGANPRRRRRRSRKHTYSMNPRRRRRHSRGSRRSMLHNPAGILGGLPSFKKLVPYAITAGASVIVTNMAPGLLRLQNNWAILGAKAGVGVLGGAAIGKFAGKDYGVIWAAASLGVVLTDLLRQFAPGIVPGFADIGAFPYQQMGAFPTEQVGGVDDYAGFGAAAYESTSPY